MQNKNLLELRNICTKIREINFCKDRIDNKNGSKVVSNFLKIFLKTRSNL